MSKPAEEGRIWEWRAFGELPASLAAEVRSHPIRMGISDVAGEDIYLVSPLNDQNIKLRSSRDGTFLKFKLLEARVDAFELYYESNRYTFGFPIERIRLDEAARLLDVHLDQADESRTSLSEADFTRALSLATPQVTIVVVRKLRSQFEFEEGWFELADVEFPARQTHSISIHAHSLEVVEQRVGHLSSKGMEVINYVEACRRWCTAFK